MIKRWLQEAQLLQINPLVVLIKKMFKNDHRFGGAVKGDCP